MIDLRPYTVAQWKCNETGGTLVADSSGNGHNGTSANAIVGVAGKIGGALSFNGTSDFVNTNNNFQSVFRDSFTISLWIKANNWTPSINETLFGCLDDEGSGSNAVQITLGSFGQIFGVYEPAGGNDEIDVNVDIPGTNWLMVTLVIEKETATSVKASIYANAVAGDSLISNNNIPMGDYDSTTNPYIGWLDYPQGDALDKFNGLIDNVCIFNKALSTDEIAFLYNGGTGTESLTDQTDSGTGVTMDDLFSEEWNW